MHRLNEFLDAFIDTLSPLIGGSHINSDNVVISGANAIKAHGLILNREPADLDIAVYQPTPEQMKLILKGEKAMTCGPYPEHRVFKFKAGHYCQTLSMDIVVEFQEIPTNLLYHVYHDLRRGREKMLFFKVQSIETCIAAKRMYNREKDWRDFQDLKNSNFNMTQHMP